MGVCPSCGTELSGAPKFCPECGTKLEAPAATPREARKTVTVLFSDVADSTALGEALDPEAVRGLMSRYFAAMKAVIERHGGTVEKFIGDAVMAVFGIPTIHEDDALRAVRAAAGMREALAALNVELAAERGVTIQTRTGITTGEVVAGDPNAGQTLVTGDTVNTAARLEQAAGPGEILIGEPTWRLVRDAVTAEPVDPVAAKGKALPVRAHRLISVAAGVEGHLRRLDAPLVGRERELARLTHTWRDAVEQCSPQLFTLLGTAGVGKSRLLTEFLAGLADTARILRGRCLPYGEGITYWPLAEALRAAAAITDADDRAAAQAKLRTLVEGEPEADLLALRLATAIGLSDEPAQQAELFWAVRRTLEHLARAQPTVVVWEDIHWAEPIFLDLIDHLAEWSRDAPLLVLCPARPELLDTRPGWGGGKLNATSVLLEALPPEAAGRLIDALPGGSALPDALRQRIATAAEGNPLFVEELLAMLVDDGILRLEGGQWTAVGDLEQLTIPPTIAALLSARLDRLTADERRVAEHASVVGRVFEPGAVAALDDAGAPALETNLLALVRKELVRPDRSEVTGGDAFKFRHVLIRDAAYAALPKRERVELHQRFARWLEHAAGDRASEFAEIIGHHLEQAYRYQIELGDTGARPQEAAAGWLLNAGRNAIRRDDRAVAERHFLAACELAGGDTSTAMEANALLGRLYIDAARLDDADRVIARALELAEPLGAAASARVRVLRLHLHHLTQPSTWVAEARQVVAEAVPVLEAAKDDAGLTRAWSALSIAEQHDPVKLANASDRAFRHATRSGDPAVLADVLHANVTVLTTGEVPVSEALPRARELLVSAERLGRVAAATIAGRVALLEAMALDFKSAARRSAEAVELLQGLGLHADAAWATLAAVATHQLMDEPSVAEKYLRDALGAMDAADEKQLAPYIAGKLAYVIAIQGRIDEAATLVEARMKPTADDFLDANWTAALARIAAARGDGERAVMLAERVLELTPTQFPTRYAMAQLDLAHALAAAGRSEAARSVLEDARATCRRKGNLALERLIAAERQRW